MTGRWSEAADQARKAHRRWLFRLVLAVLVLVGIAVGGGIFMLSMPGRSHKGALPPLTPEQIDLRDELRRDLVYLASTIGERNVYTKGKMHAAIAWLERRLREAGIATTRQAYEAGGATVENLVGEMPGHERAEEILVVGAHYDTVVSCPGANDNGTGVVGTLAIARRLAATHPARTLRFVFFANEEPPFFRTSEMGSLVYARRCRARDENIVAMFTLETIGHYSDEKGSQRYPFPVGLFFPSTANFITFVGNLGSRSLVRKMVGSFRRRAAFPSEGAAVPSWITGVGWSDHWSFWQAGYPGVMVTDTALFRYRHYHTPGDTVDKIRFDRLSRVVDGLVGVTADLARAPLPPGAGGG